MEAALVLSAKNGDQVAFSRLVSSYSPRVYSAAYFFLKNSADAMDVTQEVFTRMFRSLDSFDEDRPLYPWLRRITKNLCINHVKRSSNREVSLPEAPLIDDRSLVEDSLIRSSTAQLVRDAMTRLSEDHRIIIELKHFEDCSYREIAEILDVPIGTVMSRLYNARKNLRAIMEAMGYDQ